MSDVDDQRAREEQKAAALESGAGGEDAASKKASSPQASKEEGCVMFRPWSRDAWVFATGRWCLNIHSKFLGASLNIECTQRCAS